MPLFTLPGSWIESMTIDTFATNRTGATLVVGDVCAFDLTGSDGDVATYTSTTAGAKLAGFSNVIEPDTPHLVGWLFCVAMEATANDAQGKFRIRGVVDIHIAGSSAVASGDELMPQASDIATKLANAKTSFGIALEAGVSAESVIKAVFDGYQLGSAGAAAV